MNPPLLPVPTICLTDKYPQLLTAGMAIYADHQWKDGFDTGHQYVAQVFDETCKEVLAYTDCIGDSKVLSNGAEAFAYAELFAASPKMAALLFRLTHPDFECGETEKAEARALLEGLGFNMTRNLSSFQ